MSIFQIYIAIKKNIEHFLESQHVIWEILSIANSNHHLYWLSGCICVLLVYYVWPYAGSHFFWNVDLENTVLFFELHNFSSFDFPVQEGNHQSFNLFLYREQCLNRNHGHLIRLELKTPLYLFLFLTLGASFTKSQKKRGKWSRLALLPKSYQRTISHLVFVGFIVQICL